MAYYIPEAVCTKDGGISFHPGKMAEGLMYAVRWKGEVWALRKNGSKVEFYTIRNYNSFEKFLQKIKEKFSTVSRLRSRL